MADEKTFSNNDGFIKIHYFREDGDYDSWSLWLWKFPDGIGKECQFNGKDEFGAYALYPLKNFCKTNFKYLGLIIKRNGSWEEKESSFDRVIKLYKFARDENNTINVFIVSKDNQIYADKDLGVSDEILISKFIDFETIEIKTNSQIDLFRIYENGHLLEENIANGEKELVYKLKNGKRASFENAYKIEVIFKKSHILFDSPIFLTNLYKTSFFTSEYTYNGVLGAIYEKKKTTFRVWSPISRKIKLRLYENGTPCHVNPKRGNDEPYLEVEMERKSKGVFEAIIKGDLEGKYYTYIVYNAIYNGKEIVDPYAYSTGVNGQRGMIVDFSKTNPIGFDKIKIHPINFNNLTVYETHFADLTSSKTWTKNESLRRYEKTFLGACLKGTTYTKNNLTVSTGFDHIRELGVNAVQFLPLFDQANDETNVKYNWGYNPANYNTLEGAYSTNPYDGYMRIIEFKTLVKEYNKAGINIIMDVVYNHMNGAAGSNFDVLMPGYYFRLNENGTLSNGSGCGNETASEMPMMRKFIIDSVCFWASEYKLGGFRFDLMGLHDLETMNELTQKLRKINPHIIVYGEPWCGGMSALPYEQSASQGNLGRFKNFGAFNDKIRDALIKGGMGNVSYRGFATNESENINYDDVSTIINTIKGTINIGADIQDASKLVNYASCHDNFTLFDRIKASNVDDEIKIRKMASLANSIVFTANGISFMLSGEEFLRTKKGNSNSYNAPYEINELDYSLKIKNLNLFNNYQKLIEFKKTITEIAIDNKVDYFNNIIKYNAKSKNSNYVIYHAGGHLNEECWIDVENYFIYLSTFGSHIEKDGCIKLEPFETLILKEIKK